jgi:hypothetical protein
MQGLEELLQLLVVAAHLPLNLFESRLNRGIGTRDPAKLDKGPHDLDVHGNGPFAPQNS